MVTTCRTGALPHVPCKSRLGKVMLYIDYPVGSFNFEQREANVTSFLLKSLAEGDTNSKTTFKNTCLRLFPAHSNLSHAACVPSHWRWHNSTQTQQGLSSSSRRVGGGQKKKRKDLLCHWWDRWWDAHWLTVCATVFCRVRCPELMYLPERSVLVSNLIERMEILLHHTGLSL